MGYERAARVWRHERGPAPRSEAEHPAPPEKRQAGNRAMSALLEAQAKLRVGASGDRYEREADEVARRVVQRLDGGTVSTGAVDDVDAPPIARTIQRRGAPVGAKGGDVDPETEERLEQTRKGGRPLAAPMRARMESAFGTDFGDVKVHSGPEARELNSQLGAKAFTLGRDIFFHGKAPADEGRDASELMAHELAHVVQQR